MGMGEPLLNYEAVMPPSTFSATRPAWRSVREHITLSTVGVVPGIVRLADERRRLALAVSLHAATQAETGRVGAGRPSLAARRADGRLPLLHRQAGRKIFFEWTLIQGRNDSPEQAEAVARLMRRHAAQVNLIPLNPTIGFAAAPGDGDALDRFRVVLAEHGIPSSVRQRRGIDIAAGCGQLVVAEAG